MDPRVRTTPAGLITQQRLSTQTYDMMNGVSAVQAAIKSAREQITRQQQKAEPPLKKQLEDLDTELAALSGGRGRRRGAVRATGVTFAQIEGQLPGVYAILQGTDNTPTSQATKAVGDLKTSLDGLLLNWKRLRDTKITSLNGQLKSAGLDEIRLVAAVQANEIRTADKDADEDEP
jgi:hypothetical protein